MTAVAIDATWATCAAATAGVIGRPWRLPEWVWAVATAVVLTSAVYAAAHAADAAPLPLLSVCAPIANAASFVLPISNPAHFVPCGGHMPPPGRWFASFARPSIASVLVTRLVLCFVEQARIADDCRADAEIEPLSAGGKAAFAGLGLTAILLAAVSAFDGTLGLPTARAGVATALGVSAPAGRSPVPLVRHVSWGVLPLVAGLFVPVEALNRTGLTSAVPRRLAEGTAPFGIAPIGAVPAFAATLPNSLPAGLEAASAIKQSHAAQPTEDVGLWRFPKVGAAMPPAPFAAPGPRPLV